MSFRLFAYYCAICGGWAAFFGWLLGIFIAPSTPTGRAGVLGLSLGLMVALGLSMLDSMWVLGLRRFFKVILRVVVACMVGALGGLIGGMLGQTLLDLSNIFFIKAIIFVAGWTVTGFLVGSSIGAFEILASLVSKKDLRGSSAKFFKCMIGGTLGGLLGGSLAFLFKFPLSDSLFPSKHPDWLWTPTSWGFVALGMCIGLLVGLAQIILKDAWIKVEAGFRPGREMLVTKERTSIGRAEGTDIALFGDMGIEKLHAHIVQKGSQYFLEDTNTPGGTFVNDVKVTGLTPLKSGDLIRLGKSLLRFYEKTKKSAS